MGGLNVVRALGLARIPVVIASRRRRTSMASRYCSGVIDLPPFSDRQAVVEVLIKESSRFGKRVPLFYDNDDRLALVQDYRDALAPHFALLLNQPALADALLDKARFQALAERHGLPVPRRIEWHALEAERGPVLVKPTTRTGWQESSVRLELFSGDGKARIFSNGAEARAHPLVASLAERLSFQEYVPGTDRDIWSLHGFCAPGGELLAWFVGRKIRTFPEFTGDSSYLALARDEQLVSLGREIAARLGLAGIFKMDFKKSSATGRYYLFEINTRFNLWHYLGAACGVNLPQIAYEYLLHGKRPVQREARLGVRWLAMEYDLPAFRAARKAGKLSLAQWLASIAYQPMVYDVFSWSDPMPLASHLAATVRSAFKRRMHRWHATAS